jgi:putative DNA primase/helicase
MVEVVDQAERALLAQGRIFSRGSRLVHMVNDWTAPKWMRIPEGLPVIAGVGEAHLRELMSAAADWIKYDGRSESWKEALPPEWAPKTLVQRGQWLFPQLNGISDAPVLRADGTVHDDPGYDPESCVIFAPGNARWPRLARRPTHAQAVAAYRELCEPFCDVPFAAESDRAAAIALILTMVGRSAISGPVPMFGSGSSTPGAGKGLVVDVCSLIATGREASKMAPTRDDEEMRKRLVPIALSAAPLVMFDNVEGLFGSASLAYALTSNTIRDRNLGTSEDCGDVPLRTVLAYSGNNVQLIGDLGRRVLPMEIDPQMEHPEDRDGFRHPRLKEYASTERARLYIAALTLLAAFIAAGRPPHGKPAKGSYEAWDGLIRAAIIWAGGADLMASVERLREDSDPDLDRLRELIGAWRAIPTLQDATVAEILAQAQLATEAGSRLRAAVDAYAILDKPMTTTRLGQALARLRGRPCGGYRIERCESAAHGGAARWRVAAITR